MTAAEFIGSLSGAEPPVGCTPALQALWHAGKKNWEQAHTLAQEIHTKEGSWVHAYLHRVEGDLSNADYWYRRSGHERPACSLEAEWEGITKSLLSAE